MKIYFISQWYFPEPDGRVSMFAESMAKRGHDVNVITAFPNYPQGRIYAGYKMSLCYKEVINGVNIIRLPIYPDHSSSAIKRILNYISFSISLFVLAPWLIKKPDVFWVYTPFVVVPSIMFKWIFGCPYSLEITDIWPDTIFTSGMIKLGFLSRLLERIAKYGYKHASAITVQNPGFKTCLVDRGVKQEKISIVENWADEKLFKPSKYDTDLAQRYNLDNSFIIMFAGNMGIAQGLSNVIEAANLVRENIRIKFVFIGDGVCLNDLKKSGIDKKLENIFFIDRKPLIEMPAYFSIADVLLVNLRDDPLFEITLPSKTQTYLACGKPIVIAKRGEDAQLLEKNGCGIQCEPDNPEALAVALNKLFSMSEEELTNMGKSSLAFYNKKYRKDRLVSKMENTLLEIIPEN